MTFPYLRLEWGGSATMRVGRPIPQEVFLDRPRLLDPLPLDQGGVVILEAPYGYGKSVLLSQWAERAAESGLRVVWVSHLPEEPLKAELAVALDLPEESPWRTILRELERVPTLLVLDDLAEVEPALPLLKDFSGPLGIASRKRLSHPELPKLAAAGRLTRLSASDLAFTPEEAEALVGDPERARELWRASGGWPIALHLAAITGEPDWNSLAAGLEESLEPELFSELLLLAAARELPEEAATEATRRLAELGLVQRAEGGFRLHAALAEALPRERAGEVLTRERDRLPPLTLGLAYERLGMWRELAALLEAPSGALMAVLAPRAVLRWDRLAPGPRGKRRRLRVALACLYAGDRRRAVADLVELAREPDTPPLLALEAYGVAFYELASPGLGEVEEALRLIEEASRLLPEAADDREFTARYLSNVASVYYFAGRLAESAETLARAAELLGPESEFFHVVSVNLATLRFETEGDLLGYAGALEEATSKAPMALLGAEVWVELGRALWLLGRRREAEEAWREAAGTEGNRLAALAARIELARARGNAAELAAARSEAELLGDADLTDRARAYLARLLDRRRALELVREPAGFYTRLAAAELRQDPALLPRPQTREERLHYLACRYRMRRDPADLDELLALTNAGARILPALVPLSDLPRDRPELAAHYPLEEVLASGWREAVAALAEEIPPLSLRVLGEFSVKGPLGEVKVAGRAREVLALLAAGFDREEVAASVWPGADRDKARNNLYVQLNHLRRLLEPWGVPTYLSDEGLVRTQSDLAELEEALSRGDLKAVAGLYREPVFPGVDNPRLDEFRRQLRERVRRLALDSGEVEGLELLFELDPSDEEVAGALVRRLVSLGRHERARRVFERFKAAFEAEIEEPAPPFEELLRPA